MIKWTTTRHYAFVVETILQLTLFMQGERIFALFVTRFLFFKHISEMSVNRCMRCDEIIKIFRKKCHIYATCALK